MRFYASSIMIGFMTTAKDSTQAYDIMSPKPITVLEGTSVEEAIKLMVNHKITGLPVVDARGKMIGVVSEYDVLEQIAKAKRVDHDLFRTPMSFSRTAQSVTANTPLETVVRMFIESRFRRLPVVDEAGSLIGIITRRDLMRLYYYRARLPLDA